jgi:hypothetical protein
MISDALQTQTGLNFPEIDYKQIKIRINPLRLLSRVVKEIRIGGFSCVE